MSNRNNNNNENAKNITKKQKTEAWLAAKEILHNYMDDGIVKPSMSTREVYNMREEFKLVPYNNFYQNFRTLRETRKKEHSRVIMSTAAMLHDRKLYPVQRTHPGFPYPRWDQHAAMSLLKEDIDNGKNLLLKPKQLWESRPEYKEFPLNVFRKHIYQEVTARKERSYWLNRKKKKQEQHETKATGKI